MERTTFEEWHKDNEDCWVRQAWEAATEQAAAVARACCEVYGAEFAQAVYDKVMEGTK